MDSEFSNHIVVWHNEDLSLFFHFFSIWSFICWNSINRNVQQYTHGNIWGGGGVTVNPKSWFLCLCISPFQIYIVSLIHLTLLSEDIPISYLHLLYQNHKILTLVCKEKWPASVSRKLWNIDDIKLKFWGKLIDFKWKF